MGPPAAWFYEDQPSPPPKHQTSDDVPTNFCHFWGIAGCVEIGLEKDLESEKWIDLF